VPWRGSRIERSWPEKLMHGATWPWQAATVSPDIPTARTPS
jgi:hypothetical protein